MSRRIIIGIDPGVKTGVAVWEPATKQLLEVCTKTILEAFRLVESYKNNESYTIATIYIEDARKVKFKTSAVKAQGAGSIKRDCQIWEEFVTTENLKSVFLRPSKALTKINKVKFEKLTGWSARTSNHARDAAMLVFGRS